VDALEGERDIKGFTPGSDPDIFTAEADSVGHTGIGG